VTGFVLDASVTMTWLLGDASPAGRSYAAAVLESLKRPEVTAEVPVVWGLEVANVIAKAEERGSVAHSHSEAFLHMLACVPVRVDPGSATRALSDTLHLARRYRLSTYDASYLELALRRGWPLATLDAHLGKAARKAGVRRFSV
jgi:predicted nucleic acid-binding protein